MVDEVIAIKYVAVNVVKDADGAGVFSFVFHLRTSAGATFSLGARYSVLRRLSFVIATEQADASASLPTFPPKHSLRRQTPEFLLARGRALEAYLGAVLGDSRLSVMPAVRQLLRAAEPYRPSDAMRSTALSRSSSLSGPELRSWQSQSPRRNGPSDPGAALSSSRVTAVDVALHPVVALILTCTLGALMEQVSLCMGCCALGLAAGRILRAFSGVTTGTIASSDTSAQSASSAAAEPITPGNEGRDSRGSVSTPSALEEKIVNEALRGHRLYSNAVAAIHANDAASGWKFHERKQDVDVWLNQRPDGTLWCLGEGIINKTPNELVLVMEDDSNSPTLDKLYVSKKLLKVLPTELLKDLEDGWEPMKLELSQRLFKSPAWPVAPRDIVTVRLQARRTSDGTMRTIERSIDIPGVDSPSGYTRGTLMVGGYEFTPTVAFSPSGSPSKVRYINMFNPNGGVPQSIVKRTVPGRALAVSLLRSCAG